MSEANSFLQGSLTPRLCLICLRKCPPCPVPLPLRGVVAPLHLEYRYEKSEIRLLSSILYLLIGQGVWKKMDGESVKGDTVSIHCKVCI